MIEKISLNDKEKIRLDLALTVSQYANSEGRGAVVYMGDDRNFPVFDHCRLKSSKAVMSWELTLILESAIGGLDVIDKTIYASHCPDSMGLQLLSFTAPKRVVFKYPSTDRFAEAVAEELNIKLQEYVP